MKKSQLFQLWTRDEKTVENQNVEKKFKACRRQAENALGSARDAFENAQEALEDAYMASLRSPNFEAICQASESLAIAEAQLALYTNVYEATFGSKPVLQ